MSTPEKPIESKKSPQDASQALTDVERLDLQRKLANPLDFPPEFRTWLEGFIETALPTSKSFQALAAAYSWPVGYFRIVPEDLSANSGAYVWTDPDTGLQGLYCNGAAVSQTTYAALYAAWGASKYKADSGGNFTLPDPRGRGLWLTGTHAACTLGDNDGVTESSRQPKHTHTDDLAISGDPFMTSISFGTINKGSATGNSPVYESNSPSTSAATVTGSVGSGMNGSDAVAHYFIGSLIVRI